MNNAELAEALDLKIRPRGGTRGYHIGDSFFYDDEGNIAMIRVTREVVAVAHLYQRVGVALTTVLDAVRIDATAEIFAAEPM